MLLLAELSVKMMLLQSLVVCQCTLCATPSVHIMHNIFHTSFLKYFLFVFALSLSLRVNVGCGPAEERVLLTGLHAVADIYCENCKTTLGWKYVSTTNHIQV